MGKNIALLGAAGAGQYCKMPTKSPSPSHGLVVRSARLREEGRLDPAAVHASISGGAAGGWAMTNLAPRALAENYAPGFT